MKRARSNMMFFRTLKKLSNLAITEPNVFRSSAEMSVDVRTSSAVSPIQ
ncbi:MAG: hypothetical protein MPL62_11010 [Alphaproteobacteria bacterium]|nr:hypothetical protein [Alphaproteobacteria bacterium]